MTSPTRFSSLSLLIGLVAGLWGGCSADGAGSSAGGAAAVAGSSGNANGGNSASSNAGTAAGGASTTGGAAVAGAASATGGTPTAGTPGSGGASAGVGVGGALSTGGVGIAGGGSSGSASSGGLSSGGVAGGGSTSGGTSAGGTSKGGASGSGGANTCNLPEKVSYKAQVQPFLIASCGRNGGSGCHVVDTDSTTASGGFNHAYDWITGASHASSCANAPMRFAVTIDLINAANPASCSKSRQMPPPGDPHPKPTPCQVAAFENWLRQDMVTQMHRDDGVSPTTPYPMPPFN